jgi:sodium transport system permease protein
MSGSVVRLIAAKELRDLVRDRRTVMIIIVLPAVLYPLFGLTATLFASSLLGQPTRIGLSGSDHLPGADSGFPPLLDGERFAPGLDTAEPGAAPLVVRPLTGDPNEALRARAVDAVLVIPPDFTAGLNPDRPRPVLTVLHRDGDDKGKLAARRLTAVVRAWEEKLIEKRLNDHRLRKDFHRAFTIEDPMAKRPGAKKAADELRDLLARVFPFILMMWLVAGAMQPAVDMTAGEKERGTMETLLISPAERSEIVVGKWLAGTAFSFASVVWNVLWLTGGGLIAGRLIGFPIINLPGMIGCVVLGVPLAMFFSAVCLALGVFARSTKEGQYYLLPLILLTMPLAFWSMMPGSELSPANCWVPVTGAMLFQQKLLSVTGDAVPWGYFLPVFGSLAAWVALALAFAIWQFRREQVLFRESVQPQGVGVFRRLFKRSTAS